MMNRKSFTLFITVFSLFLVGVVSSCKKDKETTATITVVDADGQVVPGASVRLYGKGSCATCAVRFDTIDVANGSGKVTFNFSEYYKKGQAGFAVLDVKVCKGTLAGTGIIKIQEENANDESISVEAVSECTITD
jgi:hypothetical protein